MKALIFLSLIASCYAFSYPVTLRSQKLQKTGRIRWSVNETVHHLAPYETAIIVVDMWNNHWCTSAAERVGSIAILLNETISAARKDGVLIIHAPSECSSYYNESKARQWVLDLPNATIPTPIPHSVPIFPIGNNDGGCDIPHMQQRPVWTHENDFITIYDEDAIIENIAQEYINVLSARKIKNVIFMGVHENMCLMNRQFSIEVTLSWGLRPILCRELTDTMYDPSQTPYVSHERGTELMTEYIEKFWTYSMSAYDILNPRESADSTTSVSHPQQFSSWK